MCVCVCVHQLETQLSDLDMQAQHAAGQLSDSVKLELEEAQRKLALEQKAKAKLAESNQSLKKVSE